MIPTHRHTHSLTRTLTLLNSPTSYYALKLLDEQEKLANTIEGSLLGEDKKKVKESKEELAARLGMDVEDLTDEVVAMLQEMDLSDDESSDDESEVEDTEIVVEMDDEEDAMGGDMVFYERTIEDVIEEQRAALTAAGIKGTPVTAATFAVWKETKKRRRQLELEARVKAEQAKKKGGKGLSVLSGKELFSFDEDLFKDDEGAGGANDDDLETMERKQREEREALLQEAAEKQAQKEQDRLMELQRAEAAAALHALHERGALARAPGAPTFDFEGVQVNAVVFSYDEMEDLLPFRQELGALKKILSTGVTV